jgi:hypothetical protein
VLLGTAVFALDSWLRAEPETVVVSEAVRREVASRLEQNLSRAPTRAELERGLEEWVDTELLLREATALGLAKNDTVIREHLAQKLKHIVRERTIFPDPSQAELRAQLAADRARYTAPETFDVTHVFIQRSVAPAKYESRVQEALAALTSGAKPETVGDHFPRDLKLVRLTRSQLEQILGVSLSAVLTPTQVGKWQAVESPRGAHLIRLVAISPRNPDFASLRPVLLADVLEKKKQAALAAYLVELRKKYSLDSRAR